MFFENHDLPRTVSRFANDGEYKERKAAGYSEEELMTSIYAKGRDNARTPMQWNAEKNAGFTEGTPWINVNPNYTEINVEKEIKEEDSVFHYYKRLISLRKTEKILINGKYEPLMLEDPNVFAYTRKNDAETLLVVCNFTDQEVVCEALGKWSDEEILLRNYKDGKIQSVLRPYEAVMMIRREGK